MSTGVRLSPAFPPIVPRIPEIDLINATEKVDLGYLGSKNNRIMRANALIMK